MANNKIELFIAGAQKAGTTSLLHYLNQHPKLNCQQEQEFIYFLNDDDYGNLPFDNVIKKYFIADSPDKHLVAKNVGVMYSEKGLARLHNHNPLAKIVVLVREPVKRAYSAFWYARRKGIEDLSSFEDALNRNPKSLADNWVKHNTCDYIGRGEYAKHLKTMEKYFPKEQIKVFLIEDLKNDSAKLCNDITEWMGLESYPYEIVKKHNAAAMPKSLILQKLMVTPPKWMKSIFRTLIPISKQASLKVAVQKANEATFETPPINPETASQLKKHFKSHNEELATYLDRDLSSWQ